VTLRRRIFLVLLGLLAVMECSAQSRITVGRNVQVSKSRADRAHFESYLAADPSNSKHLVGGAMIVPAGPSQKWYETIAYVSVDGGDTWQPTIESPGNGDPVTAFGVDGTAYFAVLSNDSGRDNAKTLVYRSPDGGRTWLEPVTLRSWSDREYLTIDRSGGPFHGHIYLNATGITTGPDGKSVAAMELRTSSDYGATFSSPVARVQSDGPPASGSLSWYINGPGVVLSDGSFGALVMSAAPFSNASRPGEANGTIGFISSWDGGATLSTITKVADWHVPKSSTETPTGVVLAIDATPGPFHDRLYVAWPDVEDGRTQILLTFSSDKGKTWAPPTMVSDDSARAQPGSGPDDFMSSIAVNSSGVVGVSWYDRRDDPDNLGYSVRFAASWDGGDSFSPSVPVSESSTRFGSGKDLVDGLAFGGGASRRTDAVIDLAFGYRDFTVSGGDTAGLAAAADGTFHPFWIDARTGIPQVWTAKVTVEGQAIKNGSAELSAWEDVTNKVVLELVRPTYDRRRRTIEFNACLENTSPNTLIGPLKARVFSLRSRIGTPASIRAAEGSSRRADEPYILDVLEAGVLKPGDKTNTIRVVVTLTEARWPEPADARNLLFSILQLRLRVLEQKKATAP